MEFGARERIILGVAPMFILLLGSPAAAQNSEPTNNYLRNIEVCNGPHRTSLEPRINGCTAFIDSGQGTTAALATAHNNRGNAYITKGDYDRAIQDFDQSIKLNPAYAKPFNNHSRLKWKPPQFRNRRRRRRGSLSRHSKQSINRRSITRTAPQRSAFAPRGSPEIIRRPIRRPAPARRPRRSAIR
jgi:tetratricopeptide (TPR) repeat protein